MNQDNDAIHLTDEGSTYYANEVAKIIDCTPGHCFIDFRTGKEGWSPWRPLFCPSCGEKLRVLVPPPTFTS